MVRFDLNRTTESPHVRAQFRRPRPETEAIEEASESDALRLSMPSGLRPLLELSMQRTDSIQHARRRRC